MGASATDEVLLHDLTARYSEPHRKYHTLQHLDECFERLAEIKTEAVHPEEVEFALWFHDAVYDTKRQDNEVKSADWARSTVLAANLHTAVAERVHALVMATRHNAVPSGTDERILVDVDLSILGAKPERFDEYDNQIREEYSWVPGIVFRSKRRAILKEFLARPTIFSTQKFIDAYEVLARENLERSIEQLGG
ncbi:MAG: HD domain-containing protein [Candidatus Methylomirabilales bacterium]